jgi:prephenate dehydrogenase
MNVFVIGTGLIGGSLALDIKAIHSDAVVYGIDQNEEHINKAIQLGVIDKKAYIEDLKIANIVIISVPVDAANEVVINVLDVINDDCLVFDVGSTKLPICNAIENHKKRTNFVAAHPIAGTEFSGPTAALKGLFVGKTNIICEIEKTGVVFQKKALQLFEAMGFSIRFMKPKSHDTHIAYMSHLSHISSFMLGKTVIEKEKAEKDIFDMAGSGFESTVRLAKSSPAMWTPIFKQNKKEVVAALQGYIDNLSGFKSLLEADNFDAVFEEMKNVNKIKVILNGLGKK